MNAKFSEINSPGNCRNCYSRCNFLKKNEPRQPNILFIMSDDHAYQAISAYGYDLNHKLNNYEV